MRVLECRRQSSIPCCGGLVQERQQSLEPLTALYNRQTPHICCVLHESLFSLHNFPLLPLTSLVSASTLLLVALSSRSLSGQQGWSCACPQVPSCTLYYRLATCWHRFCTKQLLVDDAVSAAGTPSDSEDNVHLTSSTYTLTHQLMISFKRLDFLDNLTAKISCK